MRKSKLILLLQTLTKEEMKRLGLFISSPFFHRIRNFEPLYNILKEYHPEFNHEEFTEEKIFNRLYPEVNYNKKKSSLNLRVLFSQFDKYVKKFMLYEQFETEDAEYDRNNIMAAAFRKKKLIDYSLKEYLKNYSILKARKRNVEKNYKLFAINQSMMQILLQLKKVSEASEFNQKSLFYLFAFMLETVNMVHNNCEGLYLGTNRKYTGREIIKSFVKSFETEIFEKKCPADMAEITDYALFHYYILISNFEPINNESIFKANEKFYKIFDELSHELKWSLFQNLLNCFMIRYHIGKEYTVMANKLTDFVFERGILSGHKNGYLDIKQYNNALLLKSSLLGVEEIKNYIGKYIHKTAPHYYNDLKNFSLAIRFFKEKNFAECLEMISRNDLLPRTKNHKYKLKLTSLFELNMFEEAIYTAHSYEKFLNSKNNLGPLALNKSKEFLKSYNIILKVKIGNKNINIDKLMKVRETDKHMIWGNWLYAKVDKIVNK